ncbi:hypothetical protein KSU03_12320 [Fusobacterium polymorphum]|uniref:Uncharacterized protein n=1 Tax=Fusobacterium nucleatum subsp. polymorphum TaxID=76857 RepID=A0A2C6BIE2_FUSNP|nr:hypothetical protein [Fusobacterium polymorphum]PHI04337.1 hypothetical protein CBG52_11285 [Fusobacterium polymorphum]
MENINLTYTYEELNKEKSFLLLSNFICEIVMQKADKYIIKEDERILSVGEVQNLFIDRLAAKDDEEYDKLISEIMDKILF